MCQYVKIYWYTLFILLSLHPLCFDRWVMLVEKRICDVDGKLMIYHENLKRLKKRLDILKQIHEAPQVYAKLVVEVVRRRKFSTQFLKVTTFHPSVENILMRKNP